MIWARTVSVPLGWRRKNSQKKPRRLGSLVGLRGTPGRVTTAARGTDAYLTGPTRPPGTPGRAPIPGCTAVRGLVAFVQSLLGLLPPINPAVAAAWRNSTVAVAASQQSHEDVCRLAALAAVSCTVNLPVEPEDGRWQQQGQSGQCQESHVAPPPQLHAWPDDGTEQQGQTDQQADQQGDQPPVPCRRGHV